MTVKKWQKQRRGQQGGAMEGSAVTRARYVLYSSCSPLLPPPLRGRPEPPSKPHRNPTSVVVKSASTPTNTPGLELVEQISLRTGDPAVIYRLLAPEPAAFKTFRVPAFAAIFALRATCSPERSPGDPGHSRGDGNPRHEKAVND